MQENILFKALSESEQESIVGAMERMAFAAVSAGGGTAPGTCETCDSHCQAQGSTIIKQGDQGDYFYVLESGHCDIFVDGVGKVRSNGLAGTALRYLLTCEFSVLSGDGLRARDELRRAGADVQCPKSCQRRELAL